MSNKKETIKETEIYVAYDRSDGEILCAFVDKEKCKSEAEESGCGMIKIMLYGTQHHALQMESQKQQKYDEMLAMLESCVLALEQMGMKEPVGITQLVKEAKEL